MREEQSEDKGTFLEKFKQLRPDLFFPEEWSQSQRDEAMGTLSASNTRTMMFSSIPLKCLGPKCTYADTCPLQRKGIAPIDSPCSIEISLIRQFTNDYILELQVDPDNLVEVSMIRDLVDQEIQYIRKSKLLAKEDFVQENIVGISPNGEPIVSKQLHLAVELEDRIHRRKKELRNALLATREARAKIGQGNVDTAQAISNIFEKLREIESEKDELLRKKLGTVYKDDYIDAHVIEDSEEVLDEE